MPCPAAWYSWWTARRQRIRRVRSLRSARRSCGSPAGWRCPRRATSIVDKSPQILRKKERGGTPQVISVACSISTHDRSSAVTGAGVAAALVHSRMKMAEREATLRKFERGGAEVIVQVGLLEVAMTTRRCR